MNKIKIFILLLFFYNSVVGQKLSVYDSILKVVRQEEVASVADIPALSQNVAQYLSSSIYDVATGCWTDIDYKDKVRTNASWVKALTRLKQMALAYSLNDVNNIYYNSDVLYKAINTSLLYFCSLKPTPYSTNWYYQGVTRPQLLALTLINMDFAPKRLTADVKQAAINIMCKDTAYTSWGRNNPLQPVNQGSNRSLIAMDWLYIGALLRSDYMLKVGAQESFSPIKFTKGEGIQRDLSYNMHYGYLYTGSYGTEFVSSVIKAATYTAGTRFAIKKQQLKMFRQFVLQSVVGTIRGQWIDWNVVGRAISRPEAIYRNYAGLLKKMQCIDKDSAALYTPIIERMEGKKGSSYGIIASHRYYWTTDYTLHIRPSYTLGIHAISSRTKSSEIGNKENLKGYWSAAGATDIQVKGDEYNDVFPLWNWTKIPGTTLPDSLPLLGAIKAPGEGDRKGSSAFAGGVSDSLYGVTAYEMKNELQTSAKKAWFQFDDAFVCLGAGISSQLNKPVHTTVNQCLLKDKTIYYSTNDGSVKKIDTFMNRSFQNGVSWVLQDGIGYYFPKNNNISLITEHRKANWLDLTHSGAESAKSTVSKNIFELTINHGVNPNQQKYEYIVVPAIGNCESMEQFVQNNNIVIEANSDSIQAVYHKGLEQWQIVFYKSNVLFQDDSIQIKLNHPAVSMIRKDSIGSYVLHIADPTHKLKSIRAAIRVPYSKKFKKITILLPKGVFAGQSVKVNIFNYKLLVGYFKN